MSNEDLQYIFSFLMDQKGFTFDQILNSGESFDVDFGIACLVEHEGLPSNRRKRDSFEDITYTIGSGRNVRLNFFFDNMAVVQKISDLSNAFNLPKTKILRVAIENGISEFINFNLDKYYQTRNLCNHLRPRSFNRYSSRHTKRLTSDDIVRRLLKYFGYMDCTIPKFSLYAVATEKRYPEFISASIPKLLQKLQHEVKVSVHQLRKELPENYDDRMKKLNMMLTRDDTSKIGIIKEIVGNLERMKTMINSFYRGAFGLKEEYPDQVNNFSILMLLKQLHGEIAITIDKLKKRLPIERSSSEFYWMKSDNERKKRSYQQKKAQRKTSSHTSNAPKCPHCGRKMIRRLAKQGFYAGKHFWGCSSYPKCRVTRSI